MEGRTAYASRPQPLQMKNSAATPASSPDASARPTGGATPPETPTRSDSVTSTHTKVVRGRPTGSEQKQGENRTTKQELIEFSPGAGDYEVLKDKKLGAGRFSQVYLARSTTVTAQGPSDPLTPPATPTSPRSRGSCSGARPTIFAVKVAVDKSSANLLRGEARVLLRLCQSLDSSRYMVPFYGFDSRSNTLVLAALPGSLEDLVNGELQQLDVDVRTAKLSPLLRHIGRSLTSGLKWMHSLGVVHADIKPPNILLRADVSIAIPLSDSQRLLDIPFTPVFADFTSSFVITDNAKAISSIGGGTYDYMAPEQLSAPFPLPDFKMDVYALAVSLLQVITGYSPFRQAGSNRYVKMAMIKEGKPLEWATRDATSEARLEATARTMSSRDALDLKVLLEAGLRKNPNDRLDAESWSQLW